MKNLLLSALVCALSVPALAVAPAPSAPWDGTWKLDPAKSHFEGATFTYSKTAKGMWHYSDGGAVQFDFAPDGKPYAYLTPGETTVTTPEGDHAWTYVNYSKGKMTSKVHEVVSADGKTLTDTSTSYRPDGTTSSSSAVYTRVSGSNGFEGKWKSTKVNVGAPEVYTISTTEPGAIRWVIPAQKQTLDAKLDGSASKPVGPTVPDGLTISFIKAGERELKYVVKLGAKTLGEGRMIYAADGKSMTDESWTPGKMDEKETGFYVKQ